MSEDLIANSVTSLAHAIARIDAEWHEHHYLEISITRKAGQRTLTQNRALHKFCTLLAETLNDAGFDMKRVLREDVDIPWTCQSAKDYLWRPIQKALTDKDSTTEITTVEPTEIHRVLARHLGEKLGVECPPWPARKKAGAMVEA